MSHKIFDDNLVGICKSKLALKLVVLLKLIIAYYNWVIINVATNFIMITLKINMTINQNYYLQTLTV